jgi:hypothetical protein
MTNRLRSIVTTCGTRHKNAPYASAVSRCWSQTSACASVRECPLSRSLGRHNARLYVSRAAINAEKRMNSATSRINQDVPTCRRLSRACRRFSRRRQTRTNRTSLKAVRRTARLAKARCGGRAWLRGSTRCRPRRCRTERSPQRSRIRCLVARRLARSRSCRP